jgi:hypothetical protein
LGLGEERKTCILFRIGGECVAVFVFTTLFMRLTANRTLEPTRVGAFSSAVAVHVYLSRVAQLGR